RTGENEPLELVRISGERREASTRVFDLIAGDRVVGRLDVGDPTGSADNQPMLEELIPWIAIALDHARSFVAVREQQARLVLTERMAAVGTLAAGVAHEINNPLAYVMLNLEMLSREIARVLPPGEHLHERRDAADIGSPVGLLLSGAREGAARIRTIVRDL